MFLDECHATGILGATGRYISTATGVLVWQASYTGLLQSSWLQRAREENMRAKFIGSF